MHIDRLSRRIAAYRQVVQQMVQVWRAHGLPSGATLMHAADELERQRHALESPGLWVIPPLMVLATVDDGIGQGISIIGRFARAVGIDVRSIGLMQDVDAIVDACFRLRAAFLGLTVLQFDSETIVAEIVRRIPETTRTICGGPVFQADPEFARRTGIHATAKHVGEFLEMMLTLSAEAIPSLGSNDDLVVKTG